MFITCHTSIRSIDRLWCSSACSRFAYKSKYEWILFEKFDRIIVSLFEKGWRMRISLKELLKFFGVAFILNIRFFGLYFSIRILFYFLFYPVSRYIFDSIVIRWCLTNHFSNCKGIEYKRILSSHFVLYFWFDLWIFMCGIGLQY